MAVGMPPFSMSLLLFPTLCFLWLWPQLIPTVRNRPQGLLFGLTGTGEATERHRSLEGGESALGEKLASEIGSHGGGACGSWDAQGLEHDSLHQGLPTAQKVTDETKNKHGRLFWDLDYPVAGRRSQGSGAGAGCSSSCFLFCLLLAPALGTLALRG